MHLFIDSPDAIAACRRASGSAVPGGGLFDMAPRRFPAADGAAAGRASHDRPPERRCSADADYSIAQESYQEGMAFDRRRHRRRRIAAALRAVALILAIPLLIVAVFLAAYAFTCIMDGATFEELGQLMLDLIDEVAATANSLAG